LTFPRADEHPLMRSFMGDAGQRIEGLLAEWASLRERAQFECFLALGRRSRRPVLSTMDDAVLLNRSARELHPVDQASLLAAAAGTPVLIAGEPGTGKLAVARALHELTGRGHLEVLDAASALADGRPEWLRQLRRMLADAETTVVVRHLERCDDDLSAAAAAEIDAAPDAGPRLFGTVDATAGGDRIRSLLDQFCVRLVVPPLRDRRDDTDLLV